MTFVATTKWRSYEDARTFIHSLNLPNIEKWIEYSKSGKCPPDIPHNPRDRYKTEWRGFGDWLGNHNGWPKDRKFLPFEEARAFARSLKLRTWGEWKNWCSEGKTRKWCDKGVRPANIPSHPEMVYKNSGWVDIIDWLGVEPIIAPTPVVVQKPPRPTFEESRTIARGLGLATRKEWMRWWVTNGRKAKILRHPEKYPEWVSWPDWLDSAPTYLSFAEGRTYARSLDLLTKPRWEAWATSGERPPNMPSRPQKVYRSSGWVSWPDWLGSSEYGQRVPLPYAEALIIAHDLCQRFAINTIHDWYKFYRSGQCPPGVPRNPNLVYSEWVDWYWWLNKENPRQFLSFVEARELVRTLGIRSCREYLELAVAGKLPPGLPRNPDCVY